MSRFSADRPSLSGSWYRVPRAPFLFSWGLYLWLLGLVLAVGLSGSRRSPAEVSFDDWATAQQRPAAWRKCHDEQPLASGMVRCEAGFGGAGRVLIYCPGESSTEQTCRWS